MYSTEFTVKVLVKHHDTPPVQMIRDLLKVPAVERIEVTTIETDYQLHKPPLSARVEQSNISGTGLWEQAYE